MDRNRCVALWAALATMAAVPPAHAQAVHKCTVDGQVTYQSALCPASSADKVVPIPPPPSDRERREAAGDARLQQYQARGNVVLVHGRELFTPPPQPPSAPDPRPGNCEVLRRDVRDAQYRRDELQAPGEGANRVAALARARDDIARLRAQAAAIQCAIQ